MAQMGVDTAVLQETKIVNEKYTKAAAGYTIMCSKAVSTRQGGVGLLWKNGDSRFEVKSFAFKNGPNIVTFQVVTGNRQYYVGGVYIPPNCHLGVDEIRAAMEACPLGCTPIVMGDLNANIGFPRDDREECWGPNPPVPQKGYRT